VADCADKPSWTLKTLLEALPSVPADLRQLLAHPLDSAFRERLMLAVAAENRCRYCEVTHGLLGRTAGLSRQEVDAILNDEELQQRPEKERLALAHVRDLARRGFRSHDDELRARLLQSYSPDMVATIEATARLMNLANRAGNSFDKLLARFTALLPPNDH
jgi:AhpD family alkylhydroperoxidase